jgi:hypothetical protein
MKNLGLMNFGKCLLFILTVLFLMSCGTEKDSKKASENENKENVIFVDAHERDSLYRLYDSVSKLWHRSRKELTRLDQMANTKAAYNGDFEMEYESSMQYVFQLATELNELDSICSTVGIYTFNYKIYKTPEEALQTLDSVLNNKKINLTVNQKKAIRKDRKRLTAVKNKVYKYKH